MGHRQWVGQLLEFSPLSNLTSCKHTLKQQLTSPTEDDSHGLWGNIFTHFIEWETNFKLKITLIFN